MSDDLIFREVDEEVRRDRSIELARKYGGYVIAVIVVAVAATAGIVGWQSYQASRQAEMGARFEDGINLLASEKYADAAEIFESLAGEADNGYKALAGQQAAAARAAAGDDATALSAFDRLAADTSLPDTQRDLAAIKGALLALRVEGADAALQRIAPVADGAGIYRLHGREVRAAALLAQNDRAGAIDILKSISEDATATTQQKARVGELLRTLGA